MAKSESQVDYGDGAVARAGEILRCLVGSQVHGLALPGSDRDEMAIYIEPVEYVLGITRHRDNYVSRTKPECRRSEAGDIDLVAYGLSKYLNLAIKSNPTILLPLFAPMDCILSINKYGTELRAIRHAFLSQQAVLRFLGYMESQLQRMLGVSNRHVPNRPELIERYGFDTKYAAHALRLAYQAQEIAETGDLTLPMPLETCEKVLAVKTGQVPKDHVILEVSRIKQMTRELLARGKTPLPEHPNIGLIEEWAIAAQKSFWGW